jgi:hypothetical protein
MVKRNDTCMRAGIKIHLNPISPVLQQARKQCREQYDEKRDETRAAQRLSFVRLQWRRLALYYGLQGV